MWWLDDLPKIYYKEILTPHLQSQVEKFNDDDDDDEARKAENLPNWRTLCYLSDFHPHGAHKFNCLVQIDHV